MVVCGLNYCGLEEGKSVGFYYAFMKSTMNLQVTEKT